MEEKPEKSGSKGKWLAGCLIISAIVVILAIIVIPNFLRFQDHPLNYWVQGRLKALHYCYSVYHSDWNTYPAIDSLVTLSDGSTAQCMSIADWEPKGTTQYAYECMNRIAYPNTWGEPIDDCPVSTSASKDSFTVAACGNLDSDSTLDVWTINEKKELINLVNDLRQ